MARKIPRPFKYEWGGGQIVEEAACTLEHHEAVIQLMRYEGGDHDGAESIRFAFYNLRGAFQRHPLMIGRDDLPEMREALKQTPRLRSLLQELVKD